MLKMDKEWLNKLKVGDKVYIDGPYGRSGSVETVSRLTKTLIITTNNYNDCETKYRKTNGYKYGGSGDVYYRVRLRKLTQERIDNILLDQLKTKAVGIIKNIQVPTTIPDIRKLIEALKPYEVKNG